MSIFYAIGCDVCHERARFMRDSLCGFGWMPEAKTEALQFVDKHRAMGHDEHLRVFSEHSWRFTTYAEFTPAASRPAPTH